MFCDVTLRDRLMPVTMKAMHTASTHNVLPDVNINVHERFGVMTDTHATDAVAFYFKGTGVRCVVCGTIDYQINFVFVHNIVK